MESIRIRSVALMGWLALTAHCEGRAEEPAVENSTRPKAEAPAGRSSRWTVLEVDPSSILPAELARRVTWDIQGITVREAAAVIRDTSRVPVVLSNSLVAAGTIPANAAGGGFFSVPAAVGSASQDCKVSTRVVDVPLWAALEAFVADTDDCERLAWEFESGAIVLKTADHASESRKTVVYDLAPFRARGIRPGLLERAIPKLITGPWDEVEPGTATINHVGNTFAIRTHAGAHRELAALWKAFSLPRTDELTILESEATRRVEDALDADFVAEFRKASLADVAAEIERQMHIPVVINSYCREQLDEGDEKWELDITLARQPLRDALKAILDLSPKVALSAIPDEGRLLITSLDQVSGLRSLAMYDLAVLEEAGRTEELLETLQQATVGPWDANEPGTGNLAMISPDLLLVRQTYATHRELQTLIQRFKELRARSTESRHRVETRAYFLKAADASALQTMIARTVAVGTWEPNGPGISHQYLIPEGKLDPSPGEYLGLGFCCKSPPEPMVAGETSPKPNPDVAKDARVSLAGDPSARHAVLLIRHEYDVHRKIDDRIQQFFVQRRVEICPGRTAQYGYLVDDIDFQTLPPNPPSK